jgi:hypothetical protein
LKEVPLFDAGGAANMIYSTGQQHINLVQIAGKRQKSNLKTPCFELRISPLELHLPNFPLHFATLPPAIVDKSLTKNSCFRLFFAYIVRLTFACKKPTVAAAGWS